jgi:hypothetical protein
MTATHDGVPAFAVRNLSVNPSSPLAGLIKRKKTHATRATGPSIGSKTATGRR